MVNVQRLILAFLIFSFSSFAFAYAPTSETRQIQTGIIFPTKAAACASVPQSSLINNVCCDSVSGTCGQGLRNIATGFVCYSGQYPFVAGQTICQPVVCTAPQIEDPVSHLCVAPPCIANDPPTGYLATNSCLNGCAHVWSGQMVEIGKVKYYGYLGKTGATCATGNGTGLFTKSEVDAAMNAADAQAIADAAAAKAALDAKNAAAKAKAEADAAASKAASDAAAKAEAEAVAAKAASDAAAAKAAADAAAASPDANQSAADAAAKAADAATKAAEASQAAADAAAKAGSATGSAMDVPEAPEFCTLHPTSIICKNSSVNAGSCSGGQSSGFSCSGDAIQCQIAKEQQEANCKFYQSDDALTQSYNDLKSSEITNPTLSANIPIVNVQSSLDASSSIAAGCPVNKSFPFMGHQISIPISMLCPYLEMLGYVFLALSYIAAARILGGSV